MFGTGNLLNDGYSPAKMIFADPIFAEKKGKIIEGQVQVYSSPLEHKLNVPEKTDNNVDRIIFETAKTAIKDGSEFLFIHFEEVDDIGHAHGPHSEEAIKALNNVGYYITELQKLWTGKIFIFSDHGMHPYYNHETSKIQGTHNSATIDDVVSIFIELQ
jgi:predicted AlkP superfamily pyrophosphatase or phosphodiesterase